MARDDGGDALRTPEREHPSADAPARGGEADEEASVSGVVSPAPPSTEDCFKDRRSPDSRGALDSRASFLDMVPEGVQDVYQSLPSTAATAFGRERSLGGRGHGLEPAEMELKVRELVLELVKPTIRKVSQLDMDFDGVLAEMKVMQNAMEEHWRTRAEVDQARTMISNFAGQMARWDGNRAEKEEAIKIALSQAQQDMDDLRYKMEKAATSVEGCERNSKLAGEVMSVVQKNTEALQSSVSDRLERLTRSTGDSDTATQARFAHLQAELQRLEDVIHEGSTNLAKVTMDFKQTTDKVGKLTKDVGQLKKDKADLSQVYAMQEDVRVVTQESNKNILSLKQVLDKAVIDMKEHFRTATRTMADHTARSMEQEKEALEVKFNKIMALQQDIATFREEAEETIKHLKSQVSESRSYTEQAVSKMEGEVKEVGKIQTQDRSEVDVQTMSFKETLSSLRSAQEQATEAQERILQVLWTVTQSERMASAMDLQDTADKGSIALMGFKEEKAGVAPRSSRGGSRPLAAPPAGPSTEASGPVINVDQRCLSCSGQASTVISGFKMACLQYQPGPVNFGKRWHSRGELHELREKLLEEAQEALAQWSGGAPRRGPGFEALAEFSRRGSEKSRPGVVQPGGAAIGGGPAGRERSAAGGAGGATGRERSGSRGPVAGSGAAVRMPPLPLSARGPPALQAVA